jgi:hypothetical protein
LKNLYRDPVTKSTLSGQDESRAWKTFRWHKNICTVFTTHLRHSLILPQKKEKKLRRRDVFTSFINLTRDLRNIDRILQACGH